jgi:hypothetical protein
MAELTAAETTVDSCCAPEAQAKIHHDEHRATATSGSSIRCTLAFP